ncbi:MAG: hypothetical protein KA339_09155 [Candidatus Kapabacteria bacterium]|nr:hypothetical protein [Ignavibacteria bacterium]MBK6418902.1 hypothetical protein [Ignavibacteria bacterium]MBK7411808.1 hypothetical protein [Ignavibacteria bacterium]MBP6510715.1 hypothetical protein [Candidatus Kapabacteria bacterium]MBP7093471.1 hypothetical protein [Candidatus Kapabacteria bacterium]
MSKQYKFSKKKIDCPCGKSSSFCPLIDNPRAGKCFSHKCGQQFIAPKSAHGNGRGHR